MAILEEDYEYKALNTSYQVLDSLRSLKGFGPFSYRTVWDGQLAVTASRSSEPCTTTTGYVPRMMISLPLARALLSAGLTVEKRCWRRNTTGSSDTYVGSVGWVYARSNPWTACTGSSRDSQLGT